MRKLLPLLALAACSEPAPVADGPESPLRNAPEFADCTWGEVKGAGLAMGAFACGPAQGGEHVVADPALPGLVVEWTGAEGPARRTAVRLFDRQAGAPVESILPAVKAASPGELIEACALVPAEEPGRFSLEPTGEAKARWEASVQSDTPIAEPCGPLGVGIAGDRYFAALAGRPDKVVFVELGSEIQIYDPATLKAAD